MGHVSPGSLDRAQTHNMRRTTKARKATRAGRKKGDFRIVAMRSFTVGGPRGEATLRGRPLVLLGERGRDDCLGGRLLAAAELGTWSEDRDAAILR